MTKTTHVARAVAVGILAFAVSSCATRAGRDFDAAYAQQIKPDETTKAEVRNRLGRPALVQVTADHDQDVWTYAYYEGGGFGTTLRSWLGQRDPGNPTGAQQKSLVIRFKGDKVKETSFSQHLPPPDPLEEAYR